LEENWDSAFGLGGCGRKTARFINNLNIKSKEVKSLEILQYLTSIGGMLDVGNIVFTIANLPQIVTAIKNRKNLVGLSDKMLIGYSIATLFFFSVAFISSGWIAVGCCTFNWMLYSAQIYWKRKYKPMPQWDGHL